MSEVQELKKTVKQLQSADNEQVRTFLYVNPFTFILLILLTFSQDILSLLTVLKQQKHVTEAILRVGVAPMIFFSISNLVA
jgi:hypothetical protein